jgi:hypothetical protein
MTNTSPPAKPEPPPPEPVAANKKNKLLKPILAVAGAIAMLVVAVIIIADIGDSPEPVNAPPVLPVVVAENPTPEPPTLEPIINERGNTVGNIVNLGYAAQQGDWIYYFDGWWTFNRIRTDGSDRQLVE